MRKRIGFVLLICGLAFLTIGSGGFNYLMADRTATIHIADDPDAHLGIIDNSADTSANIDGENDTGNAYFLDDNAAAFTDASAFSSTVIRVDYDGTTDTDPGLVAMVRDTDDLEGVTTSHDYVLQLECEDGGSDQGTGYVTVTITAQGSETVDAERTTNENINIDCT